jgi:hypothetical protein
MIYLDLKTVTAARLLDPVKGIKYVTVNKGKENERTIEQETETFTVECAGPIPSWANSWDFASKKEAEAFIDSILEAKTGGKFDIERLKEIMQTAMDLYEKFLEKERKRAEKEYQEWEKEMQKNEGNTEPFKPGSPTGKAGSPSTAKPKNTGAKGGAKKTTKPDDKKP